MERRRLRRRKSAGDRVRPLFVLPFGGVLENPLGIEEAPLVSVETPDFACSTPSDGGRDHRTERESGQSAGRWVLLVLHA